MWVMAELAESSVTTSTSGPEELARCASATVMQPRAQAQEVATLGPRAFLHDGEAQDFRLGTPPNHNDIRPGTCTHLSRTKLEMADQK
eukprot:CAMPEP_0179209704 /NCGR_PEP_ID=MMETSP0796-20121207/104587_1 /TAXON_ID=73915 /ORGANISM="Pyrodinium bahamense, Strain pbaha01" /LENGTH=87 /DNA_ID=CAMNT_0020914663 /DNA_START=384 /DNA_END=647 /DNA_ORIENTATION=+